MVVVGPGLRVGGIPVILGGGRDGDVDGDGDGDGGAAVVVGRTGDEVGPVGVWVGEFVVPPAGVDGGVDAGGGWDGCVGEVAVVLTAADVGVLGATVLVTGVPVDGTTAGASRV